MANPNVRRLARTLLGTAEAERIEQLHFTDAGHRYDTFGLSPEWVAMATGLVRPLYENYFRVRSVDAHHIPSEGGAILAANHSGTLPFDGAMLYVDVLKHTDPPRIARAVADTFVPGLPFVSVFFSRCGVVGGSRGNVRRLLERGELLMIFPEGTPGIGKPFKERYQLQHWRVGHCEMAIRHRVPVVPVGIVGAEEQMPQVARIPVSAFGSPYIPVPATPLPLPVRYHIYYGEPIDMPGLYEPGDADDPDILSEAAERVRDAVDGLLQRGLSEREGVFA